MCIIDNIVKELREQGYSVDNHNPVVQRPIRQKATQSRKIMKMKYHKARMKKNMTNPLPKSNTWYSI